MSVINTCALLILLLHRCRFYESCPLEYHVTDEHHSYCSQPYPDVIDQPLTETERLAILQLHNQERQLVRGTNIEKMYWNDDLAEIALRYARGCIFEHDRASQRNVPRIPLSTGQNLAMGYENWTQAIGGWIEEKEHYFHGYSTANVVAHYTQMIWHSAVLVGCAATMCPPYGPFQMRWPFYVCNYVTGQLDSNLYRPYNQGVEEHPLHDCQGKVCLYNGTLDLKTCQCQCSTYATGSQCEHLNCSRLPPCPYPSPAACIAVNVPSECPRLCGLCDRYEVLQQVYGEHLLAPDTPANKRTTTTSTMRSFMNSSLMTHPSLTFSASARRKSFGRKLKKKLQKRPRTRSTVVFRTTSIISSTSKPNNGDHPSSSICSYLLHSLIIVIITSKSL